MTTLELALSEALAEIVQDHWRVALALRGAATPPPRDPELAALFHFVRANGADLMSMAEEHPEATRRHVEWAAEPVSWTSAARRGRALDSRYPVAA
ncbi:MAG: hypothetical protein ABR549_14615 [Mycobacteriales bacterium]